QKADASAIGAATLVRATEGRGRAPCSRHKLSNGQARSQDLHLEGSNIRVVDQRVIDSRNRILPDEVLGRNFRTVVAGLRTHVAVGQLEPSLGESFLELVRVLEEVTRDLLVLRVETQREVARQHRRANALVLVVSVRN